MLGSLLLAFLICDSVKGTISSSNNSPNAECMTWALRRIIGADDVTPMHISTNDTDTDVQLGTPEMDTEANGRGYARPGKRGPSGPPGIMGPVGPPGVCDCIPEEVRLLQRENGDLKEKLLRIRLTSPETFCLLGMKDGSIKDGAISSTYPSQETYARLDSPQAWWPSSSSNPGHDWVMCDLGSVRNVTGVVTQGRRDAAQWVKSFKVEHSINGTTFLDVTKSDGSEQIFNANTDQHTKIVNRFPEPVMTRFIRIYPMTHSGYMSMRFDVIDC